MVLANRLKHNNHTNTFQKFYSTIAMPYNKMEVGSGTMEQCYNSQHLRRTLPGGGP